MDFENWVGVDISLVHTLLIWDIPEALRKAEHCVALFQTFLVISETMANLEVMEDRGELMITPGTEVYAGMVVGEGVIIGSMKFTVRWTEELLMKTLFTYHGVLGNQDLIYDGSEERRTGYTLEGGDVHVLRPDLVLLGMSERSSPSAFDLIAEHLVQHGVRDILVVVLPTLVHAHEHFISANHFLTCSAAPIFDPRGNMLGVLDVTGDQASYHQHTMGLVRMSARMIENHWLSDDYAQRLRIHFHLRPEFIGTLLEGIVVLGGDGRILGANRSALDLLDMSSAALRMQSLSSLFDTSIAAVIASSERFRPASTWRMASSITGISSS